MKIIYQKKVLIKDPMELSEKDGMPWCDEHEEYYEVCICPKVFSTPDEGWLVDESGLWAYPTEELYNELSMWIERSGNKIVCTRCGNDIQAGEIISDVETMDLVESFFDIHSQCIDHTVPS